MIEKPTVLILGAGASHPYKFPIGRALNNAVLKTLESLDLGNPNYEVREKNIPQLDFYIVDELKDDPRKQLYDMLKDQNVTKELIIEFRSEFSLSRQPSIDAFVQRNKRFADLGKAMIAYELLKSENFENLIPDFGNDPSWFDLVWHRICQSPQDYLSSKVSIVTFNYDRSLEMLLYSAIKSSFRESKFDPVELYRAMPILHVYGSLGELPFCSESSDRIVDYGATVDSATLQKSMEAIRLIPNRLERLHQIQIQQVLQEAEVICFLGFAYDSMNLNALFGTEVKLGHNVNVFGTGYSMGLAEIRAAESNLQSHWSENANPSILLGNPSQKSADFLRSVDLWEPIPKN